ncbi:hypothetical protein J4Q44_G00333930 [Coregonus suidteri]|uniref:Uncharacterized protein n=1 Tax=Coregonus suidteri TaxID=861788 RepID=A0AAN8KUP0_9TELE
MKKVNKVRVELDQERGRLIEELLRQIRETEASIERDQQNVRCDNSNDCHKTYSLSDFKDNLLTLSRERQKR